MRRTLLILFAVVLLLTACSQAGRAPSEDTLVVVHAGSLSVPFAELEAEFEKANPGVDVLREAAGSRKCARMISELGKEVDIFGSADYSVIENLLFDEYATWNISFVTNEMAIMYSDKSLYRDEINGENWMDILLRPDVSVGRSNPNADPCGYRALLTWQLAERHYNRPGLYDKLVNKKKTFIRDKETDLIALVEAGELDYLFIYRSVAQQHHSPHVILDDEINLKSPAQADFYSLAKVDISGKNPGEKITQTGAPMIYGITIPRNAPHPKLAEKFLLYLFSEEGVSIMEKNGQPFIRPPYVTGNSDDVPKAVKKAFSKITAE